MQAPVRRPSANAVLLREPIGPVAVLTLNRPQARNSLSEELLAALTSELAAIADDRAVRAVVLAANGPAFCAGHDMRELLERRSDPDGGKAYFEALMAAFDKNLMDHIAVYGPDNDKRLTGKHETAPWNKFSYGVADRGASIRVPHSFVNNGYKGYLEDRRPNSQGDPYQIASQILKTISSVPTDKKAAA